MPTLWNKEQEKDFFIKSLEFATPEQLFYFTNNKKYYALIIGNSDYDKWDDLVSPVNDTNEIAKVLKEKYKFVNK